MLIIKKNHFKYVISFHFISIFVISIIYYYTINNVDFSNKLEVKYFSEIVIFAMILCITINILLTWYIFANSVSVFTELDKVIDYSKYHNFTEEHKALKRLGPLGVKIVFLFNNINDMSNKRKIKLSSLYELIEYVSASYQDNIAIINVSGDILFASDKFVNSIKIDKIYLQTININQVIDINLKALLVYLDDARKEIQFNNYKFIHPDINKKLHSITVYPVYNSEKLLSNAVISFKF